jgi:mRNA interferase MazF
LTALRRGRVYLANLSNEGSEPKFWLVVSNNRRNSGLQNALAVRITTSPKYVDLDSVVPIPAGESLTGWVRCDDIVHLFADEVIREVTAFSPRTMRAVSGGLSAALGLDRPL